MAGLQAGVRAPLYGLAAGVVLEIVAGALAFTTDALVPALALCLVGLVLLGAAGDALRRS